MRLASAYKKGISISFTFRNTKGSSGSVAQEEEYDFVLPPLVKSALDYLTKHDGVNTEGIFRVSGSMTDIEHIAKRYAKGKITSLDSILNVHTVAGLLKHYIRNRRGGLIPVSMRQCILAAGNIADEDTRIYCISKAMDLLPANNKLTLTKICEYLHQVQQNESVNKMSVYNLSLIFSSTFLPADSSVLEHAYTQTAYAHTFTETLLSHQHVIFATEKRPSNEPINNECATYVELLDQYVASKDSRSSRKKRPKADNNELQKMAILNLSRKQSATMEVDQQSPQTSENKYLDIIVAEKMCRREEVDLLSQCLMLGEPELFMQHLERISKGDSHAKDTIQKAAIKMCRNPHRRKSSV